MKDKNKMLESGNPPIYAYEYKEKVVYSHYLNGTAKKKKKKV